MIYFLIGFMGAGKSTCAAELSQRTGVPYLDLDKEIEKEYDYFQDLSKLNINLVFKANNKSEIIAFLGALKFPF